MDIINSMFSDTGPKLKTRVSYFKGHFTNNYEMGDHIFIEPAIRFTQNHKYNETELSIILNTYL